MKRVRIADLKARLSAHLRYVRSGREIVVLDRDTPVARLLPYERDVPRLRIRPARGRIEDVVLRSSPPKEPTDSLAVLQDLRADRF